MTNARSIEEIHLGTQHWIIIYAWVSNDVWYLDWERNKIQRRLYISFHQEYFSTDN